MELSDDVCLQGQELLVRTVSRFNFCFCGELLMAVGHILKKVRSEKSHAHSERLVVKSCQEPPPRSRPPVLL